jgi:hypothetical protein
VIVGVAKSTWDSRECPKCDKEFVVEEFPFGEDVQCPHCKTIFETDMEESCSEDGDESLYWWFNGEKKGVSDGADAK